MADTPATILTNVRKLDGATHAWRVGPQGQLVPQDQITAGDQVIDGAGALLVPGFLDLATRITEPGLEVKDRLQDIAQDAWLGGYTDIVAWPNTTPVIDQDTLVRNLRLVELEVPVRLHPAGAMSKGTAGKHLAELQLMRQAGAVAFTDGLVAPQDMGLVSRALQYLQGLDAPLIILPLDLGIAGKAVATESSASTALGLKSQPTMAESTQVQRLLDVLAYTGGRMHLTPITTQASIERIRVAKAQGLQVTAGTAPWYLLWDDTALADFDSRFRFQPPLRTAADVAALRAAVADGTIDTIDSHHQPMMLEDKQLEFEYAESGCPSLAQTFAAAHAALVAPGLMTLPDLLDRFITRSRAVLGMTHDWQVAQVQTAVLVWADQAPDFFSRWERHRAVAPWLTREWQAKVLPLAKLLQPAGLVA